MQNWIDCIKSRERPVADVEIGHRSTTVCHLGNIARWLGRRLRWDPQAERFVDDDQANQLLHRPQARRIQFRKSCDDQYSALEYCTSALHSALQYPRSLRRSMLFRPTACNRRQFLIRSTLTTGGLCLPLVCGAKEPAVKIERIDVFPLRYPLTGHFKFFAGARGETGRAAVIVKLTASNGTVGWGQSVPIEKWSDETLEGATIALRDYFARR